MKNLIKYIMLFAVGAIAFTSCQIEPIIEQTNGDKTYTMTFVADAPVTPGTKTSVSINENTANFAWSEGDKVGFYYVANEVDFAAKTSSNEAIIEDGKASFTVTFDIETVGAQTYNIGASYPSIPWVASENNPFNNVKVRIPATQTLTNGSFDPAADLMISKPFMNVSFSGAANGTQTKILEFSRIAAIGKMNLKLDGMEDGELIKNVTFAFAEGTNFNGPVILDLENSTYNLSDNDTYHAVALSGSLEANANGTAIFFTCFPGSYSGDYTISVETDKAFYTKEGTITTPLNFTAGNVLGFEATVNNRVNKGSLNTLNTVVLTNENIVAIGEGQEYSDDAITINAANESKWGFKGYRELPASNYLQICNDNTSSYIQLPEVAGEIHSVVLTVGGTNTETATGGDNESTYYFIDAVEGDIIASGKQDSKIILDLKGKGKTTGHIITDDPEGTRVFEITVYYDPSVTTLSLDKSMLEFDANLDNVGQIINATTNKYEGNITATLDNNAYFEATVSGNEVTVKAKSSNYGTTDHTAVLTITAGSLSKYVALIQRCPYIEVDDSYTVPYEGTGTTTPEITIPYSYFNAGAISISKSADWLTIGYVVNNDQTFTISYSADANSTQEDRSANVNLKIGDQVIKTITFTQPGNPQAVVEEKTYYTKVTNAIELTDGQYLIVYEGDTGYTSVAFDGSQWNLDVPNNYKEEDVTIVDGNKIVVTNNLEAIEFTIKNHGSWWSIKSKADYYIGQRFSSNGLLISGVYKYENTIYYSNGDVSIESSSGAHLRFDLTDHRFRYYKKSSYPDKEKIALYKKN